MMLNETPANSVRTFLDRAGPVARQSTHGYFTLFRGQRDAYWPLLPGIAREPFEDADICVDPNSQSDRSKERRLLIVFRDHAPSLLPQWVWTGPDAHVRWKQIVVAQHYRLPTRLLDLTANPLVALFFAMEEAAAPCPHDSTCTYRHPNGLHYSSVSYVIGKETTSVESLARRNLEPPVYRGKLDEPGNEQNDVCFVRPPDIDGRITAQSSFFCVSHFPRTPVEPEHVILVDPAARDEILIDLNAMGINRKTLYPGLEGLTGHLKWDHVRWRSDGTL